MLVYAIRHGECWSNANKVFAPTVGNPLTEKGKADALQAGVLLSGIEFDRIYASNLLRTQQTAQLAIPGCNPIIDERLKECDYGSLAFKSRKECLETLGAEYVKNHGNRDYTSYGGENTPLQIERVRSFMHDIEKLPSDFKLAVFAHGGTIKSMMSVAFGLEFPFRRIDIANGSVSVFEFKNDKWYIRKLDVTGQGLC